MTRIHSLLLIYVIIAIPSPLHAQSWTGFSTSCSWQGFFGSVDGATSTASLTATCSTASGDQIFSNLDLNTCYGYPAPATITIPGSGIFDNTGCVVTNVPNSVTRDSGEGSGTILDVACPGPGVDSAYLITLDLDDNVGNNNGVLACGFM